MTFGAGGFEKVQEIGDVLTSLNYNFTLHLCKRMALAVKEGCLSNLSNIEMS